MGKVRQLDLDGYPVVRYRYAEGADAHHHPTRRELKLYLIEKYGVCYHCGVLVYDYPVVEGQGLRPDTATIDHLKSRWIRHKYQVVEKVLSCHDCNKELNNKELRELRARKIA